MNNNLRLVQRALISVSDKTGITQFARELSKLGIKILSTGGTAQLLAKAGVPVVEVANFTGMAEIMGGRVKTLHPRIHGGILGRRGIDNAIMAEHDIEPIDLVVVNLYPFADTIARPDCSLDEAIENIDIGGPTLVRAAAKNHTDVTVAIDPVDYPRILESLHLEGGTYLKLRFTLAAKAFAHTAAYDGMIAHYLGSLSVSGEPRDFPDTFTRQYVKAMDLRYGENPHQRAAFYRDSKPAESSIAAARQLQGKPLSYNNIADADAALECVKQFDQPTCVILKHANPCGVAEAKTLLRAYELAYQTDPTSAFGGIIACNRPLDQATAQAIITHQFVEVIVAPEIAPQARALLTTKKNIRVLALIHWAVAQPTLECRQVNSGLLVQDRDLALLGPEGLRTVTRLAPDDQQMRDLLFAWKVAKFVKSNAIVYARSGQTIGIGAGQMSRVYSARIAAIKAVDEGLIIHGSVMASDAFLPFRDGIDAAAEAGITAVIQPGGSLRDTEVIQAADEQGITMLFTGMRHFRH